MFIPASVAELDDYAFAWCAQLSEVVFEKGSALRRMGEGCFYDSGLKQIVIPQGVEELGGKAFMNCKELWTVDFAEGLEAIGSSCFERSSIREIFFPDSLKIIGDRAFYGCSQLRKVAVPEENRLESAGARVFAGVCDDLQLVNFRIFVDLQRTEFDETIIQWTFDL